MKAAEKNHSIILPRAAFLLFLFFLFLVQSNAEKLPYRAFTISEGLADDRVNRIIRDSRGFLWFCTSEGLSRFDGYAFKNYTQADGLPHRVISDLIELEDGTYLIGTYDGLTIFNPKGEENSKIKNQNSTLDSPPMFRTFRPADVKPDGKSVIIRDLQKTRDGQIWAATMDGFYRLSNDDGEWIFHRIEYELWRGDLRLLEFIAVLEDRRGALWIGMPNGLFRFEPESGKISLVLEAGVQSLLEDRNGRIWVGSGSGSQYGINVYSFPETGSNPILTANFSTKNGLAENEWINYLFETGDGRILTGTAKDLREFVPNAREGESNFRTLISGVDVVSLGEDNGGNVWLGTETRGAYKLSQNGFAIFGEADGIPANEIFSIFSGTGDEIFVSSGANEVLRFDAGKFASVKPSGMKGRGWGWNQTDFRSRVDGDWWIATYSGVRRYGATEKFEDLGRIEPKKIYKKQDGFHSEEVFRMWEDSRGNVWIYSFGKIGDDDSYLHVWERATDKIRRFGKADGLPHVNNVTAFTEDAAGDIWIGLYSGGAARFRDGKFRYFSVQEGFPSGFLGAAHTDRKGRIWLATSNSGVVRVDNPTDENPQFFNLTVTNGLSSNRATCFTEDDFGRVYVGTGHGVSRIEPETNRIKIYSQADGLPYSAVRTCGRDANGNLWFAQKFNLVRLTPEADEKPSPPPVFIGSLQVNGESVKKLSELGETAVENLDFASEQRQIQIGFFALGFGTGETLRYQYKFANSDWSEPTAQRTVNLSLAPGNYNFQVRAVNSEGAASENPARVSFSIARPVWQRWWFLLIAAVFISGVIYALYKYRLKRLLELEKVRMRIATDLHDDIGASLSKIAILSEVVGFRVAPEQKEIVEPLESIAGTSREMVDSMSDIVWAINPAKDHLSDLIGRMRNLAGEMTELRDIRLKVHLSGVENSDLSLGADLRREIYLIFKETMNNLVKHSACDTAEIEFTLNGDNLIISVKDNGKGFDLQTNGSNGNRGGNGLPNMKKRAANMGGTFKISSETGKGSTAVLSVPVSSGKFNLKKIFRYTNG